MTFDNIGNKFPIMNADPINPDINTAGVQFLDLPNEQIESAKAAFSTRNVDLSRAKYLIAGEVQPQPGDLVLATIKRIGQHARIELANGRRAHLFPSDQVILCYGNRYAPDQFEGHVPDNLCDCHMVAAGGVASLMIRKSQRVKNATAIAPIGILADASKKRLNLNQNIITKKAGNKEQAAVKPLVLGVVGSAMNAGKTSMAAAAIFGLKKAGLKVAALKLTGTASGGDLWKMLDAGAWPVYDFTDAGFISTYLCNENELESIIQGLVATAEASQPDVIVVELADGVFQNEASILMKGTVLRGVVDGFLFAAGDSSGAVTGIRRLHQCGLSLIGIGGQFTISSMLIDEIQSQSTVPVYCTSDLHSAIFMRDLKRCQEGNFVNAPFPD
ncbi:hypothetical protein BOV97_12610 [Solemya velum gill symbiont]|uniref:DUF1611 domain-containing protein n=1 Tax=Solemya velum gill symbiont TaxID=2340 RepID=A0A1T2E4F4_SOVGS|nr:hypothetical protein BOV88_08945 [Solemya velum gill symbiont]OOY37513.1 hypothetical protein BOV89_07375 [Solemya velum gill symbiont]OOY44741.1 hypothetical protein BOV91_00450 [Solemya velum gill symbiont]OOY47704.1 hypothetical protein BOV93_06015 [Solemya velum gill symbiont]OOY49664.1 hypothetical protein BOV97_12610 [Solemya velum gill symbiont]